MNRGKPTAISRTPLFLLALSLLFAGAAEAGAQRKDPLWENWQIGFDQKFHAGVWTPVTVTVENRLQPGDSLDDYVDFVGRIEVEVTSMSNRPMIFSRKIELPRESRKFFTIYAYFPESAGMLTSRPPGKIVLRNEKGRKLREEALNAVAQEPTTPLILIAIAASQSNIVNYPMRFGARQQGISWLSAEYLPDHWCGYQGVGLLVIPLLERNRMNAEQQQAIVKWVETGGRVLVLGGKDADSYADSFLEREFGIRYMEPLTVELPRNPLIPNSAPDVNGESTFTANVSPLRMPAAKTLLKNGPLQLAARVERGLGFVEAWAFDLEDKNVGRTPLVRMLWESPVGDVRPPAVASHFGQFMEKSGKMFKDNEGQKAPSIPLIILILLIYFVVVGPLNFIALGRRKKLEWAWFTLPVIILLFSGGIYFIGVMTKGTGRILRHYNIVDCRLNQPSGLLNSVINLWSSSKRAYEITPLAEDAVVIDQEQWRESNGDIHRYLINPFDDDTSFFGAGSSLELVRKGRSRLSFTGATMKVDAKDMNQWDRGFLSLQEALTLGEGFQGAVSWRQSSQGVNSLEGRIVNNTPYRFEDVFLVMSNGFGTVNRGAGSMRRGSSSRPSLRGVRLDLEEDWAPGQELVINPDSYTRAPMVLRSLSSALTRNASLTDDQKFRRRVFTELLQSRFEQADDQRKTNYVYHRHNHTTAYLVGWCVEPLPRTKMRPAPTTEDSYSLFVLDLSPEQAGDSYRLENGAMRPVLSDAAGAGQSLIGFGYGSPKLQVNNGSVYLSLHVPIQSTPFQPGDMQVSYEAGSDSGQKNLYVMMYNYRLNAWETIENWLGDAQAEQQPATPNSREICSIPAQRAVDYVNPFSGEVIFRLLAQVQPGQNVRYFQDTYLEYLDVWLDITQQEVEL